MGWEGQGQRFVLLRCEQTEKPFRWTPLWALMPNNDSSQAFPASFLSSVFRLVLSLSDLGTWADSLPFSELEFPDLRVQQGPRISRSSQF